MSLLAPHLTCLARHLEKAPRQVSRAELFRLGAAGFFLFAVAYFMVFMQIFSDRRWRREAPKLEDLSFDYFPHYPNFHIADNLVLSSLLFVIVGNMVLIQHWRDRVIFMRRLMWLLGILYFFRGFTLIVTTAPSPLECIPPTAHSTMEMLKLGLELVATVSRTCSDNIYSGHTVILSSSFLMWRIHSRHTAIIVFSALHTTLGILMILLSHLHYTIDVLIAIFFTYAVFSLYFYGLERASLYHHGLLPYSHSFPGRPRSSVWKRCPGDDTDSLSSPTSTSTTATANATVTVVTSMATPADTRLPEPLSAVIVSDKYEAPLGGRGSSGGGHHHHQQLHAVPSPPLTGDSASSNGGFDEKMGYSYSPELSVHEWQRAMFTPRVLNNGIPRLIGWMDGLDLRLPNHRLTMSGDRHSVEYCPLAHSPM
ncbi:hypothetical protein H4R33_002181 [Dimargaris cristalligena]|uniref:Sphingomyelin synthase-like domain-containing protein n=1 Tax=Dimargaris cristalligena TaxID=215637 RepID=A0A4P9ZM76_9FUNG|nr:hypothetical protein H4R33_002181 [Dimargaris cristalligena]RKP34228.1 hypothetical protein BJ085DRAFT_38782 [Dimargaris cristalligena]|eukprot:RKP34228.1 hypothetical protein BJ085DRAFT_38782 [Dimargaris cristalligena]